jgi:hypothetical protein
MHMSYSPSATTSVCLPPSHSTHPRQDLFFIPILHYCQGYIHSSSTMTLQTCIYLIRFNQMYLIRLYIYMYIHLITYTLVRLTHLLFLSPHSPIIQQLTVHYVIVSSYTDAMFQYFSLYHLKILLIILF